jgi:hypothetical protein
LIGFEKLPFVWLLFALSIGILYVSETKKSLQNIFVFLFIFICLTFSGIGQKYINDVKSDSSFISSKEYLEASLDGIITPSDSYRFDNRASTNIPAPILGFTYRAFLTPIDVSFRWYQYYSKQEIDNRSLVDVLILQEQPKATNVIGNWAFTDRFPNKYPKYIDAYTSIDADAFSFYGNLGIFFLFFIWIGIRYVLVKFRYISRFNTFLYGISISYLSLMSFQSGLISMFISKAFALIILLMIFQRLKLHHSRSRYTK